MKNKTRLIILLVCVICFFVIAPVLVLYSMGYRFDFQEMKIAATGGIYVRTFPTAEKIIIDSKISEKPGMFSNSIFVQSLLPKDHTILIEKPGYYDYAKTLIVEENQVTKLENVLLIDRDIKFQVLTDKTRSPFNVQEKFIIKNNNLYYSNSTENAALTVTQKTTPVLKNLIAFSQISNNIVWLGLDGILYQSDLITPGAKAIALTLKPIKISKNGSYKIITSGQNIFVLNNGDLLSFNNKTSNLDEFYSPVNDAKMSSDGKSMVFYNDKNIYVSILTAPTRTSVLYKSLEKITDFQWVNNSYMVLTAGDKIIISETDYRGNINTVTLPQTIAISSEKNITITKPKIFFNQQEGKLYILTGDTVLVSEKITQ